MIHFIFNVMLLICLMGALYMGYTLHKKLIVLEKSRDDFIPLIHELQNASHQAESYLESVKKNIQKNAEWLEKNIKTAESLRDELGFLVERGNRASQELDDKISQSRTILVPSHPPQPLSTAEYSSATHETQMKTSVESLIHIVPPRLDITTDIVRESPIDDFAVGQSPVGQWTTPDEHPQETEAILESLNIEQKLREELKHLFPHVKWPS